MSRVKRLWEVISGLLIISIFITCILVWFFKLFSSPEPMSKGRADSYDLEQDQPIDMGKYTAW